jgi:hypothetical protein
MLTNTAFDGAVNLEWGRCEMSASEEALSDFLTHALSKRGWRENHMGYFECFTYQQTRQRLNTNNKIDCPLKDIKLDATESSSFSILR